MILLSLLTFALPLVFADVEFTSPAAGADVPVGEIHVIWKNSGMAPPIADLTGYTLNLMVGGNEQGNMLQLTTFKSNGDFTDGDSAHGTIGAGISATVTNGFFFMITSTSSTGGNVINYSDRFTITGLTGNLAPQYLNAALALNGDKSGPPRGGNAITSASSAAASATNSGSAPTVTVTKGGLSGVPTVPSKGSGDQSSSNTGLIAGVVIACIVFLVALIGIGIWLSSRRKRRRSGVAEIQIDDKDAFGKQPSVTALSELSADGRVVRVERVELGDGKPPPEMDSNSIRVELEGDCVHDPSEKVGASVGTFPPLTPIAPSISEETLSGSPTMPRSVF